MHLALTTTSSLQHRATPASIRVHGVADRQGGKQCGGRSGLLYWRLRADNRVCSWVATNSQLTPSPQSMDTAGRDNGGATMVYGKSSLVTVAQKLIHQEGGRLYDPLDGYHVS